MNPLPFHPLPPRRPARRAFTLVEILIVVTIIIILAGIVVAIGAGVSSGAKDRATRATMTSLDGAMKDFLRDQPEPADANWLAALQAYPTTAKTISGLVTNGNVLDGFGNPIHYIKSGTVPPVGIVGSPPPSLPDMQAKPVGLFWSGGRDGQLGFVNGVDYSKDDIFSAGASASAQ